MKIYLSGPVTGTDDYKKRFAKAEDYLRMKYPGWSAVNPVSVCDRLPKDTTYNECMDVCLTLVKMCDAIYMMKGWEKSNGAKAECALAIAMGLNVYEEES